MPQHVLIRYWQSRTFRDRAIVSSILTAVAAKGCGIILQIVAIPYAIRALGLEVYGTYAAATALFGWVAMLETGLGASMIRGMVASISKGDGESAVSYFSTGMMVVAVLVAVLGITAMSAAGIALWMGYGSDWLKHTPLFLCAGLLAGMQIVASCAARARAAFQETHINNIYGAVSNIVSAILLWLLVRPGATALTILLALNLPLVVANICNGLMLFAQKPLLRARWSFDWRRGWVMFREGSWLTLGQGGVFLERQGPMLLLAANSTAALVGEYACAIQLLTIMAGLITMVSAPLMPAIADAIHAGETIWWRRRVIALQVVIVLFGLLGMLVMSVYGADILHSLFGRSVEFGASGSAGLTCWTAVLLSSHLFYTVLVAAGRLKTVAINQILQGGIILAAFATFQTSIGMGSYFWLAAVLTFVATLVPWAVIVRGLSLVGVKI